MPSALETLVKILKLERDQGYKNTAVIGGLGAYSQQWTEDAHKQARIEMHHLLVDDISQLMHGYAQIDSNHERHEVVSYMLDRIMMRIKEPRSDFVPSKDWAAEMKSPPKKKRDDPPPPKREKTPPRQEKQKSQPQQKSKSSKQQSQSQQQRPGSSSSNHLSLEAEFDEAHTSGEIDLPPEPRLERPPRSPRPPLDLEEQADRIQGLSAPVVSIKGVGKRMVETLANLKTQRNQPIEHVEDLLAYYPIRYDDYTRMLPIARLEPNTVVTVIGTVRGSHVRAGGRGLKNFVFQLDDGTASLLVTMFGQQWMRNKVRDGDALVLSGKVSIYRNQLQMANPEWETLDGENLHTRGIVPVYRLTEGLKAKRLRVLMHDTINFWSPRLPDYVPESVLERTELADLGWALKNVHFPESWDHRRHARERLTFDELLLMQLAILRKRREWQSVPATPLEVADDWLDNFVDTVFPYEFTGAQNRIMNDIRRDMAKAVPMNRLIQGDVGSGKTAVAIAALAIAFANDKQAAFMAPTSILAEQHYRGVTEALEQIEVSIRPKVALLTGSLPKAERDAVYAGMADGSIDIVVGTHSLIQEGVEFFDLGLAIIDEQHRFGVNQRSALRGKGTNPHLLQMTATPIPRTLALVLYADLDLSVMDEMPPGRTPVKTFVRMPVEREHCYDFIKSHLEAGRQAFIVHPLVEASETIDAPAAVEAYDQLKDVFFEFNVGLLHGKMKPDDKDEAMQAFADGTYDVLVTTSVAEVGVNIPNATVMMIEGANRFGLAQLHQFRGRVGRGQHAGYCLLIPDSETAFEDPRLTAMKESTDGFELAEKDWQLRGAGDLLGARQSGSTTYISFPDVVTPDLSRLSHREAQTLYAEDPDLSLPEHTLLNQRLQQLVDRMADVT
jgi:ATP-dependent DNA helicase RecG